MKTRVATITRGDKVALRQVYWLWKGRLVGDGLNGFAGEGGGGKSTTAAAIMAAITRGHNFPDGAVNTLGPKDVMVICDEDGRNDTIAPRLRLAGADMSRVCFLDLNIHSEKDKKTTVEEGAVQLDKDLPRIEALLQANPEIVLIVPDPVTAYFGDADPNLDQDIGPLYNKMLQVAKRNKVGWLLISHVNKDRHATGANRVSGAKVMVTRPRCNWMFTKDPHSTNGRLLMLQNKTNISKCRALAFYVDVGNVEGPDTHGNTIVCKDITYIRWDGETEDQIDDVLLNFADPKDTAAAKIKAFLDKTLDEGPKRATECYKLAEAERISEDTLKKHYRGIAKQQLVIGGKNEWWWALTKQELTDLRLSEAPVEDKAKDAQTVVGAFLENMIADGAVPVAILKQMAAFRKLNWETVTTNRKRLGYTPCEVDGAKCWRKVVAGVQIDLDVPTDDDIPATPPEEPMPVSVPDEDDDDPGF